MMQLEIPTDSLKQTMQEKWIFPGGVTELWPQEQPIHEVADPRIFGTRFIDFKLTHPDFMQRLIQMAADSPPNTPGFGGQKVRDEVTWEMQAAKLILKRALLFFCRTQKVQQAHVVDRWANVMRAGDYSSPIPISNRRRRWFTFSTPAMKIPPGPWTDVLS